MPRIPWFFRHPAVFPNPAVSWKPISLCFGALLIILRGALFSILRHSSGTLENDPWFEPKRRPFFLSQPAVETEFMRRRRGEKTWLLHIIKTQNSQYLQGFPWFRASTSRHNLAPLSRHQIAPLQMKRALHMASEGDAYARLVFYVAIGWSSLPFSGWCDWPQNIEKPCCDHSVDQILPEFKDQIVNKVRTLTVRHTEKSPFFLIQILFQCDLQLAVTDTAPLR